jgi:hypothetical protein
MCPEELTVNDGSLKYAELESKDSGTTRVFIERMGHSYYSVGTYRSQIIRKDKKWKFTMNFFGFPPIYFDGDERFPNICKTEHEGYTAKINSKAKGTDPTIVHGEKIKGLPQELIDLYNKLFEDIRSHCLHTFAPHHQR